MVSGTFIIGDDLAFTASVNKEMILPMIIGKGSAGLAAILLAWWSTRNMESMEADESDEGKCCKADSRTPQNADIAA